MRLRAVYPALGPLRQGVDGHEVGPVLAVGVGHHAAQAADQLGGAPGVRTQEHTFLNIFLNE